MKHQTLIRAQEFVPPFVAALALAGCWTAPVANVQPKGEARLIQRAIPVVAVKDHAAIQSVDGDRRTIGLNFADGLTVTIPAGPRVKNFTQVRPGDEIRATVAQELDVYVLERGQLPGMDGKPRLISANAKVLMVEPSYRLLTLQYPNRSVETFKVGLGTKLSEMEAGDDVAIETTELLALRVNKR